VDKKNPAGLLVGGARGYDGSGQGAWGRRPGGAQRTQQKPRGGGRATPQGTVKINFVSQCHGGFGPRPSQKNTKGSGRRARGTGSPFWYGTGQTGGPPCLCDFAGPSAGRDPTQLRWILLNCAGGLGLFTSRNTTPASCILKKKGGKGGKRGGPPQVTREKKGDKKKKNVVTIKGEKNPGAPAKRAKTQNLPGGENGDVRGGGRGMVGAFLLTCKILERGGEFAHWAGPKRR